MRERSPLSAPALLTLLVLFLRSGGGSGDGSAASSLEARFMAKQAALKAKLVAAKEAKEAAAAAAAAAAEANTYSTPVVDENGTKWGDYTLNLDSELADPLEDNPSGLPVHPADHVLEYAEQQGLPPPLRRTLAAKVCADLPEKCGNRSRAIVAHLPVQMDGTMGGIELGDGEEAADAAYQFATAQGLSQDNFEAVRRALCGRDPRPGWAWAATRGATRSSRPTPSRACRG